MEKAILRVAHDFQNMRMAADEHIGSVGIDQGPGADVIMTGRAADVSHQDSESLHFEQLERGEIVTQVLRVAVAIDADKGLERAYALHEIHTTAEIAGVPKHIHRFEELAELATENAVGIGKEAYVHRSGADDFNLSAEAYLYYLRRLAGGAPLKGGCNHIISSVSDFLRDVLEALGSGFARHVGRG